METRLRIVLYTTLVSGPRTVLLFVLQDHKLLPCSRHLDGPDLILQVAVMFS